MKMKTIQKQTKMLPSITLTFKRQVDTQNIIFHYNQANGYKNKNTNVPSQTSKE